MSNLVQPLLTIIVTLVTVLAAGAGPVLAETRQPGRIVRVTTGAYQFRGWEQPLINGNPNLSHFCWVPVTGYHQGTQRVVQMRGPDMTATQQVPARRQNSVAQQVPIRRNSVYAKPIHVPANYIPPQQQYNGCSGKPIHVATVAARPILSPQEEAALHGAIRVPAGQNDCYARISRQQADQAVAVRLQQNPAIAVYPQVAGRLYPEKGWGMLNGQLSHQSVHGKLKPRQQR